MIAAMSTPKSKKADGESTDPAARKGVGRPLKAPGKPKVFWLKADAALKAARYSTFREFAPIWAAAAGRRTLTKDPRNRIGRWRNTPGANIDHHSALHLARLLEVDPEWLMDDNVPPPGPGEKPKEPPPAGGLSPGERRLIEWARRTFRPGTPEYDVDLDDIPIRLAGGRPRTPRPEPPAVPQAGAPAAATPLTMRESPEPAPESGPRAEPKPKPRPKGRRG